MPDYVFVTEEKVAHRHELTIELPIDMGASSERLTDRMARTVAENRALDGLATDEKVVAVWREGEQIWPRRHKAREKAEKAPLPFEEEEEA